MANWRNPKMLAEKAISAAGTEPINVRIKDPISRIEFRHVITRAARDSAGHPSLDITKVELVNGSDVLFSMNGSECQALNIYDRQVGSMLEGDRHISVDQVATYGLDFGRYLWDKQLALNPSAREFGDLQLKISHTLTNSDASATAGKLEVYAHVFDERKVNPTGFLMSKEQYNYTCGSANSYEYVPMPADYPVRKMLIRGYRAQYDPWSSITEFKIDENNEERVPYDWNMENYSRMMKGQWKEVSEYVGFEAPVGTINQFVTPTDWTEFVAERIGATQSSYMDSLVSGGHLAWTAAASGEVQGRVTGYCPNHCIEVPFNDKNDNLTEYYNVQNINNVRLRLKAGSNATNGTGQVVLQQVRNYK